VSRRGAGYLVAVLRQAVSFARARIPEKYILLAAYTSNASVVAAQAVLRYAADPLVSALEVVVALQLLLPVVFLEAVPLLHYMIGLAVLGVGSAAGLVEPHIAYYYTATAAVSASVVKLEPVLIRHPAVEVVTVKARRFLRRVAVPRTREEAVVSLKLSAVHIAALAASLLAYVLLSYPPAVLAATYSGAAFLFFFLGVGAERQGGTPARPSPARPELVVLFVNRYPWLFRVVDRYKNEIHWLAERAGALVFEFKYAAKYVTIAMWIAMVAPAVAIIASAFSPIAALIAGPGALGLAYLVYRVPVISLRSAANARKNEVERELPFFLAYATVLTSAGYRFYDLMKDLASMDRENVLLKRFWREAKFFVSLVDARNMNQTAALEHYADTHPSREYRAFLRGYVHVLIQGGSLANYMEQKLSEALNELKKKMENYVNQITTLTEIAITILVMPMLPMLIGFIISPDIVGTMIYAQAFAFVPAVFALFYAVASAMQPPYSDKYVFRYIPSVLGGVLALFPAVFFVKDLVAGACVVGGGIALGYYIEYLWNRRVFSEIERTLPQLLRDLAELRAMMPIQEAIIRMSKMDYPKHVSRILKRMVQYIYQMRMISEQPFHSRSWFWRFTQFILGKIEKAGGGSAYLFRQLMAFFTEYNSIMAAARASLRMYEATVYAIPAIMALVSYTTIGIFVSMSQIASGVQVPQEAMSQLAAQFPQLATLFQGVSQDVLFLNNVIIAEISLVLGILTGKVVSGTMRDTRALAIVLFMSAALILFMPSFIASLISAPQAGAAPAPPGPGG